MLYVDNQIFGPGHVCGQMRLISHARTCVAHMEDGFKFFGRHLSGYVRIHPLFQKPTERSGSPPQQALNGGLFKLVTGSRGGWPPERASRSQIQNDV